MLLLALFNHGCAGDVFTSSPEQSPSVSEKETAIGTDYDIYIDETDAGAIAPGTNLAAIEYEIPENSSGRIVAIGDLHGDMTATRNALKIAGAIDDNDQWIGGDLIVVQLGDQLDRGDEDREVFELFFQLALDAPLSGGAVISLLGNHEVMNVDGWMDYATLGGFYAFQDLDWLGLDEPWLEQYPVYERARRAAFQPGGIYAVAASVRKVALKIGDTVFVHGCIEPMDVAYGLDKWNERVSGWTRGENLPPEGTISQSGPLWCERYSYTPTELDCAVLEATLTSLSAKRLIVAHQVQPEGVNSACEEQVWRIDTGMSAFYGGPTEVLEIESDQLRILRVPPQVSQ